MTTPETNAHDFSWVPIYTELAKALLPYRDRQTDLTKMLVELHGKNVPVVSTTDQDQAGKTVPLKEIDPFTFYASFNRGITRVNRRAILSHFKETFALKSAVPEDFDGVPIVNLQASWFFPYKAKREKDDVPSLWKLAEQVIQGPPEKLDPKLYERCLQIKGVGPAKLSMGMFWLSPHQYIAWDANNKTLFEQKHISSDIKTLAGYLKLLNDVNAKLGSNYPEISREAWALSNVSPRQYWAGGFQWGDTSKLEEFIEGNYWQIGWKKDADNRAAKKTWAFFEQLKVSDEFAIKGYGGRNDLVIHYVGEVVDKTQDGVLHLRRIERPLYKGKAPKGLVETSWFDTLVPIRPQLIIDTIFHGQGPVTDESEDEPTVAAPHSSPLNLVLYGPPGTGKTFQTVDRAVAIIDPGFSGDRTERKRRFDDLYAQGRIEFVTFHQSYSYEDFVEGIRPVLDTDEESDSPRYECRPGAFKRLSINALFDCLQESQGGRAHVPFDVLWNALLEKIETEPDARYPGLSERTSYQLSLTLRGNIEGNNVISNKTFLCTRKVLEPVFDAKRAQDSITVAEVMEIAERGCHSQFVAAVFNELRRIEKARFAGKPHPQSTLHSAEQRSQAVQRFLDERKKSGYQLKPEAQWNKYVLVIDEINRGNISKILGELITLLEPDKRLRAGMNESSLTVTLPYSGEKFAVPSNLYVLATMNTADKSIALVDIALRRRFLFKELGVDLELCAGLTEEMRLALAELNRRIVLRKDRDHQIGHAYFMNVTDEASFDENCRRQIIPLLQEYFYNDWDGLRYVLGEGPAGVFIRKSLGSEAPEARNRWQWFFDDGKTEINCLKALISNYNKTTPA
jgi:5-methylcytosine-specific restriction protein B